MEALSLCWKNRKWESARHSARKELPSQKEYIFLGQACIRLGCLLPYVYACIYIHMHMNDLFEDPQPEKRGGKGRTER